MKPSIKPPPEHTELNARIFGPHGFVCSTGWMDKMQFQPAYMAIFEKFSGPRFVIDITDRTCIQRGLTPHTLYSIMWQDEIGRHWDEIQKAITGDDEGIPSEGIMDDAEC